MSLGYSIGAGFITIYAFEFMCPSPNSIRLARFKPIVDLGRVYCLVYTDQSLRQQFGKVL